MQAAAARGGARDAWRGFRTAALLGWKIEANWTDPILFFTYSVAKPLAAALILVVMLEVVGGGGNRDYRAFVVVGTALWSFVQGGFAGLAMSVLEDRERYRVLKYLYVSPTSFAILLIGRGSARLLIGGIGGVITLVFGIVFLGVPFDPARVDYVLLLPSLLLGFVAIVALGAVLAAVCLQTRQDSWSYPEAIAGALFLVVGVVFPLGILPAPAQLIGLVNPLAWWVEGVRRALFPAVATSIGGPGSVYTGLTGHPAPGSAEILLALLATLLLVTIGAAVAFRASERRAKNLGLIDQTTGS